MDDPVEFLISLPEVFPTPMDKYRAFRKMFVEDPDGGRVLREILSWAHLFKPSVMSNPIDVNQVMIAEGERNIGLKLLSTILVEPQERPKVGRRHD